MRITGESSQSYSTGRGRLADNPTTRRSFFRTCYVFAWFAVASVCFEMAATQADAALILNSVDARANYPAYPAGAPVVTAVLPTALGPPADLDSRGTRSDRIMAQSFRVTDPISVESIFLGYEWIANIAQTVKFRLIEVDDVGVIYNPATVNVLAGPLTVSFGANPGTQANNLYAVQLDWTGAPLILTPRVGQQGYALEFVGSAAGAGTSPIAPIRYRTGNPYLPGAALEQNLSGVAAGGAVEWVVAITGQVVPEPTGWLLAAMGPLCCAHVARLRRRRGL